MDNPMRKHVSFDGRTFRAIVGGSTLCELEIEALQWASEYFPLGRELEAFRVYNMHVEQQGMIRMIRADIAVREKASSGTDWDPRQQGHPPRS